MFRPIPTAALLLAASAPAASAQFVPNAGVVPSGPSVAGLTEDLDFGDIDADGDFDVLLANGGGAQNFAWINQGGLQAGTLGLFLDDTAARLPVALDDSRDVELGDIDGDADLDAYIVNSAETSNQGSRWWVNDGQGFFTDETLTRWSGLGGAGSTIPAASVLPDGAFIDWSCDAELADLDDDGDLDLVHSSYGGAFGGQTPTRLFLNDGSGVFTELNTRTAPAMITITDGDPGLWADGFQQAGTTDATGTFCDVATSAVDLEVGDVDGDLDLDILLGARTELPRLFANRKDGSGLAGEAVLGALTFRDVTGLALPQGHATGSGHYDQEFGDLDGDADLDVLGVHWLGSFFSADHVRLDNGGVGVFAGPTAVPAAFNGSFAGELVDYDGDGDPDFVTSGADVTLFRNDAGALASQGSLSAFGLDVKAADTDGDGDFDLLLGTENQAGNQFLENVTQSQDVTAPLIGGIDSLTDTTAEAGDRRVRASVFDGVPLAMEAFYDVEMTCSVDDIEVFQPSMHCMGGNVFRGELPANLVGTVTYQVSATDFGGNTTTSTVESYLGVGNVGTYYGSTTGANPPTIRSLTQLHDAEQAVFVGSTTPSTFAFMGVSLGSQSPGITVPGLPGLLIQLDISVANLVLLYTGITDANGDLVLISDDFPVGAAPANLFLQFVDFDGVSTFQSSQGLQIPILP